MVGLMARRYTKRHGTAAKIDRDAGSVRPTWHYSGERFNTQVTRQDMLEMLESARNVLEALLKVATEIRDRLEPKS
jgi:hypothetical protein